jgi:hypothetical protein
VTEKEATIKWQKEWENFPKAAITKQFFPNVQDRLKLNINVTPNFAAMVTGHGKTRAYFHRFKILEHATCLCNKGDQKIDHLLNQCTLLHSQRDFLRKNLSKSGNWLVSKHELITKHLKTFFSFTNSIDFDQL